jgi:uncharacterized membrane protein YjfL (UPF0719 family)
LLSHHLCLSFKIAVVILIARSWIYQSVHPYAKR